MQLNQSFTVLMKSRKLKKGVLIRRDLLGEGARRLAGGHNKGDEGVDEPAVRLLAGQLLPVQRDPPHANYD